MQFICCRLTCVSQLVQQCVRAVSTFHQKCRLCVNAMDIDKPPPLFPVHALVSTSKSFQRLIKKDERFSNDLSPYWPHWPKKTPYSTWNNNNNSACQDNSFIIDVTRCALFLFTFFFPSMCKFGFCLNKKHMIFHSQRERKAMCGHWQKCAYFLA